MKILIIDDLRTGSGATIARNYTDGINALRSQRWDLLQLDHDLADFTGPDQSIDIRPEGKPEWTGYDVLTWLERNLDEHPEYVPDDIELVTDNAGARGKMQRAIESIYRRLIAKEKQGK